MARTCGYHAIEELLRSYKKPPAGAKLFVSNRSSRIRHLIDMAARSGVPVATVSRDALDRLAEGLDHRGAVLSIASKQTPGVSPTDSEGGSPETDLEKVIAKGTPSSLVLILDHITDPHNLGAILRSADQFSTDLVVVPARRSAGLNQTVAKTSAGASAYVPTHVATNLARVIETVKDAGYWVYGAESGGRTASELKLTGRIALVVGSEGKGISPLVRSKCDELVSIPTSGKVDSLNVSVATGILLYEIRRQQVRRQ